MEVATLKQLKSGMTKQAVESLIGKVDRSDEKSSYYKIENQGQQNELKLSWKDMKLFEAEVLFDPPLDALTILGTGKQFELLGPTETNLDTVSSEWIIGEPRTGQKWILSTQLKLIGWSLGKAWKSGKKKTSITEIHKEIVSNVTNTSTKRIQRKKDE